MDETNSLAIFSKASQMLVEANTIQKAKELKDLALTAADWAKRKGMGEEAIQHCRSYALEAERKMGEMLKETDRAQGKRTDLVTCSDQVDKPTLAELGLTKRESSEAQMLADIPDEVFEEVRAGTKTLSSVKSDIKKEQRRNRETPSLPENKYQVIYADPPWKYNDSCEAGAIQSGGAIKHYQDMSIQELCDLDIEAISADDCVLFLWVTSPLLEECFDVINAWGFEYKASFVWDKIKHNMGHYNSVRHEFLLICTKGSCTPDNMKLFDSVQSIEKTDKHSQKPHEFYEIIETLYTGSKIELFARNKREGWSSWGNEA